MECRICLDDSNPETMIHPCACRGTAEWIHRRCLVRFLAYFPDGRCHVCHEVMINPKIVWHQYWGLVPFLIALYLSAIHIGFKLLFLGLLLGVGYFMPIIHIGVSLGATFILALYGLLSPSVAMNFVVVTFLGFYTLTRYMPEVYVMIFAVLLTMELYAMFITYIIHPYLDGWGNGIFNVVFVLVWVAWLSLRPAVLLD